MQKITQIMYPLPQLLAVLLLLAQPAFAEAPAGHPESIDRGLRHILVKRLNQEGYMGQSGNNMDLSRGIADYLRDNRQLLANLDFPRARQVDVLVCLMVKKGYSEFTEYTTEIKEWCSQIIKAP